MKKVRFSENNEVREYELSIEEKMDKKKAYRKLKRKRKRKRKRKNREIMMHIIYTHYIPKRSKI
tara:strand:- start:105 stop:296 length:192 start_codon:yes stop_codon:yes gene_type:complete